MFLSALDARRLAVAAMTVLAIGAVAYWYSTRQPIGRWEVSRTETNGPVDRVGPGEWRQTLASSRLRINVGSIGFVDVEPNSRVRLGPSRMGAPAGAGARGNQCANLRPSSFASRAAEGATGIEMPAPSTARPRWIRRPLTRPSRNYATTFNTRLSSKACFQKRLQRWPRRWKDSWFEEGARLNYVVPSRSLDGILPLQIEPRPLQTTRAFVGRIELLTADVIRSVERDIADNNRSTINRYGRFQDPILKRIESVKPQKAAQVRHCRNAMQGGRCN